MSTAFVIPLSLEPVVKAVTTEPSSPSQLFQSGNYEIADWYDDEDKPIQLYYELDADGYIFVGVADPEKDTWLPNNTVSEEEIRQGADRAFCL